MTVNHKVLGSNPCGGAILLTIYAFFSERMISLETGRPTPCEVITGENLRVVYEVESKIIDDDGCPHVILKDAVPMDET